MEFFAAQNQADILQRAGEGFKKTAETFFNARSILALLIALAIALVLGRIIAAFLRRLTFVVGRQADKSKDLNRVNRLRRIETLIVLSIALVRAALIILAFYFWWAYMHPNGQPTAIIGASAVVAIFLSGALVPLLRDLTYGSVMMAEHWFGVGDYVRIEPFSNLQGIVDRVTLRSTRLRDLNGEVVWINNQNIAAVRITPRGIRTLAIEMIVNDLNKGIDLVDQANLRLPNSPLMLTRQLTIISKQEIGNKLWHITAIGETAPGREWILEDYALKLIQEIDEDNKKPTLLHEPVAHNADADAERRFTRTIKNATKRPIKRDLTSTLTTPLTKPLTLSARRRKRDQLAPRQHTSSSTRTTSTPTTPKEPKKRRLIS